MGHIPLSGKNLKGEQWLAFIAKKLYGAFAIVFLVLHNWLGSEEC